MRIGRLSLVRQARRKSVALALPREINRHANSQKILLKIG